MTLSKKVIIVTGGGRGIGLGITKLLLSQNMNVVVAEVNDTFKQSLPHHSDNLLFIQTDVKSESSVEKMIKQTVTHFGKIDALINNAGIFTTNQHVPVEKLSLDEWCHIIDINLTGTFLCSKHAVPHIRKQKGSIVNIASTRAFQSEPNTEPYSASKGGIVALTHSLAISLGPDIRVNCISPGWINTSESNALREIDHTQHPVGRVGKAEDIASMVSFLISDQASFITAQNFIIDGGMTKKMIYEPEIN